VTRTTTPPAVSPWSQGTLTVSAARDEFRGLSRQLLFALMKAGTVRSKVIGERKVRLLSRSDLIAWVESLPDGK
jgi:hypothetical protein